MDRKQFESMSVEELWELHSVVNDVLAARLSAKKQKLERRLEMLNRQSTDRKSEQ